MSPTEFSNYIKQRAMQQQIHHHHNHHPQQGQQVPHQPNGPQTPGGMPVSQTSPSNRSLSPGLVNGHSQHNSAANDPSAYFFHQAAAAAAAVAPPAYHPQFPHRDIFGSASTHGAGYMADLYAGAANKFATSYLDPGSLGHQFYGSALGASASSPVAVSASQNSANALGPIGSAAGVVGAIGSPVGSQSSAANGQQGQQEKGGLTDGLNNFSLGSVTPYSSSNYQHLLVAN